MKRKRRITTAAGTLVAAAIAGVAWASIPGPGNVYTACMLKGLGTIRLIDKSQPASNLTSRCTDKEIEISWNQAGQPGPAGPKGETGAAGQNGTDGTDGASVSSESEAAGANCAEGGSKFVAATGVTYACNGAAGNDGNDGVDGQDGAPGPAGPPGASGAFTVVMAGTHPVLFPVMVEPQQCKRIGGFVPGFFGGIVPLSTDFILASLDTDGGLDVTVHGEIIRLSAGGSVQVSFAACNSGTSAVTIPTGDGNVKWVIFR